MAIYRVTVKSWTRHYGEGTVVHNSKFEARRSKKQDDLCIAQLAVAMARETPQGREPVAWCEVNENRHGTTTLESYSGASGKWVRTR